MKPPEEVIRELALEWLAKAEVDLSAAAVLLPTGSLYDSTAFHAQQAAEKALKAYLVWRQVEFPKTHDIARLLELVRSIDVELAASLTGAADLTPYGIEYRYPGDYLPVSRTTAAKSAKTAEGVVRSIAGRLQGKPGR